MKLKIKMQPPFNDGRERTKRHLIRNSAVNPESQPSPIPEAERSSPDSGSLPELVVEPAPNRHDDPPEYYKDLERRMARYYRQLFLGAHGSDDDISSDFEFNILLASGAHGSDDAISCDFEANRSVGSTITLDIDTIAQIHEPRPERPQMVDDGTRSPVLIPRFGRNSVGRHSGQSFNVLLASGAHGSDDAISCDFEANRSVGSTITLDIDRIAQIHEPRPERPQMVDDGTRSPVLIPRFGRNSVGSHSGQSINVLLASDEIAKTFSPQKCHQKSEIDKSHAEMMRQAMETRGNVSWHGATSQATPTLAFEAPTSAKELQGDTEPLSNLKKRKTAPIDDNPPVKKKK